MKLKGIYFKKGMNINHITIQGQKLSIHSYDTPGVGFMQAFAIENTANEEMHLVLSKKNYSLLKMLDEFDLTIKGSTIHIKFKQSAFKIQQMEDVAEPKIDMTGAEDINVSIGTLMNAKQFTSGKQDSFAGIIIEPEYIYATDKGKFYRCKTKTNCLQCSVPTEIINMLDSGVDYRILKTNRMILFIADGMIIYSSLLESFKTVDVSKLSKSEAFMKLSMDELVSNLKMALNFGDLINLKIKNDNLEINSISSSDSDAAERVFESRQTIETNIESMALQFSIKPTLMLLDILRNDSITLYFNERSMWAEEDNEASMLARFSTQLYQPIKMKEVE